MAQAPSDPTAEARGATRIGVTGRSMEPTLREGDSVMAEPLRGEAPLPGEVVLVRGAGARPAVHRVVARRKGPDGWLFVTMGDAGRCLDGVIDGSGIIARATAVERDGVLVALAPRRAGAWDHLRAWGHLVLHGKVGSRHPLRAVGRGIGRAVEALRRLVTRR
jgi:hypothetical protein